MTEQQTAVSAEPILSVKNLRVEISTKDGPLYPVNDVSFEVRRGEILGVVGESGSGKSMTCLAIMRLLPGRNINIVEGDIELGETNLTRLSDRAMRAIRGSRIAMILQEPMTSLDPVFSIGDQLSEPVRRHQRVTRSKAIQVVLDALRSVHIPAPELRVRDYPHQMSGGMRQRVVAAMALSCQPDVLIADEPTTALDVTIQAQMLRLLEEIRLNSDAGIILITHDFGIVAQVCQRVAVMYAGRIVETGSVTEIFDNPKHPYTAALIASVPQLGMEKDRLTSIEGSPPNLQSLGTGCPFAPRCANVQARCREEYPPETRYSPDHSASCWNPVGGTA
jgi:oligopeptide/dipeptide ABC transporter ATP-binding protein